MSDDGAEDINDKVEDINDVEPDQFDDDDPVDEIESKSLDIISEAQSLPIRSNNNDNKDQFLRFIEQHKKDIVTTSGKNFLHVIAALPPKPTKHVLWLVASVLALKLGAQMMGSLDDEGKTPLHIAITRINKEFISAATAMSSENTAKRISDALLAAMRKPDRSNSLELHVAVNLRKFPTLLLLKVIKLVPKEMLRRQDSEGLTPLHLAVDYKRCSRKDQLSVVQALISRDPSVLKEVVSQRGLSVYQHHIYSRVSSAKPDKQAANRPVNKQPDNMKPNLNVNSVIQSQKSNTTTKWSANESKSTQDNITGSMEMFDQVSKPEVPGFPNISKPTEWQFPDENKDDGKNADRIKEELKLASLRVMPCDMVLRCLQIDDHSEKEFWFDYEPGPQTHMTFNEFERHWAKLDFDSTLQYVALPSISFKSGNDDGDNITAQYIRNDATRIFKWLKQRGVQRILRVIVLETKMDSIESDYHSNDAIKSALLDFRVEILDWRRPDICPATIVSIGKHLRELRLHWSGNNAILRAWSELQGLPMLSKHGQLKRIRVVIPEGGPDISPSFDSADKNYKTFVQRLETNWVLMAKLFRNEKITGSKTAGTVHSSKQELFEELLNMLAKGTSGTGEHTKKTTGMANSKATKDSPVIISESGNGYRSDPYDHYNNTGATSRRDNNAEQHRWIECMENFSIVFRNVPRPTEEEMRDEAALAPIKVALIDDGVDTTDPSLQGREYLGRSFDFYEEEGILRNQPYWISKSRHGTIMAKFIRKLCPTADIYIIKLGTGLAQHDGNNLTVDTESAIHAIDCAVKQKARIISMSWSVKIPKDLDQRNRFNDAVNSAIRAGIIMYCASSDQGNIGDFTYPHHCNPGSIFRIGAAKATGHTASYAGENTKLDFTFPGHDVALKEKTPENRLGEVQRGSSVATALAAGLAAIVLECMRLRYLRTVRARAEKSEVLFPTTSNDVMKVDATVMGEVFRRIDNLGSPFIQVWNSFTPEINEDLRDGTSNGKLEIIARLAYQLLKK